MAKRMFLTLAVTVAVLAGLGFVKFRQIHAAIAQAASFQPPPEAVTTIAAQKETWPTTLNVIGTMVALAQWDEFRLHVRAALTEGGFTPDDIKEILLQQAIYCGVPAANHAVKEASAIVQELGV